MGKPTVRPRSSPCSTRPSSSQYRPSSYFWARERGITVVNTPGRNASAVAEFTIGAILAETRKITQGHDALRRGEWRGDLYRAELRNRNTELHLEVPVANLDTRSNLPPTLIMLCHELKTGESMMDLNALLAEVTRLRAEVERRGGPAAARRARRRGCGR